MGLRTKAYFIGAFLTFFSSMAAALGLGEIKLNSSLNQPLNAEIQLLHLRGLTERDVLIGIASPAEFERAGVERNYFVTELKFTIDLSASGGPVARVTSETPVREPFLNFVVTAQWPSGRLLREYTLLVDLPVFSGSQAKPVQAAPKAEVTRPSETSQPRPRTTTAPRAAEPVESIEPDAPTYASDTYGPVGANENLWSIASRVKPDGSVSVQQTMLAIQRLNPEAFINNNINLLRRGQVLRIPDKQEIEQLTSRDAMREVAQQNNRWSNRGEPEKAQLEGSRSVSQTRDESSAVEGRIKLSSPTTSSESGQGAGAGEGEDGVVQVLAQTQEELDAADRENTDMKSRLQSMEEQIQTMEKLMEVSSEEMRALELAAQQTNQSEQPASEVDPESIPATEESAVTPQPDAVAPPPEAKPVAPSAPVAPAKKSWMDLAMDNILYVGIGAGVLVLGLAALIFMRRRKDEFNDEFDEDFDGDSNREFAVADDLEFDQEDKTVPLFDSDSDSADDLDKRTVLAEAETEDVVGECDIHIAYGQYDQAEEKLLRALEKDPSNVPVRLKLVEVFAAQGDGDNFDAHYARLRQIADTEALDRAALLRGSIAGIGVFDAAAHDTSDFSHAGQRSDVGLAAYADNEEPDLGLTDDTLDFDFNEVDDLVDSSSKTGTQDMAALGDLDFDLHLDADPDDITRIPEKSVNKQPDEQTFDTDLADLEFELGDLDVDSSLDDASLDLDLSETSEKPQQLDDDLNFDFEQSVDFEKSPALAADDFDDLDAGLGLGNDQLTREFSGNLVAESGATDFAADLDDFADLTSEDETLSSADDALDFDLDRDLESAKSFAEDTDALAETENEVEDGLTELGLEDLQDLDVDTVANKSTSTTAVRNESTDDFDMDFDLDSDVNLDQLDQELDQLSSDFGTASPASGVLMDEPVIDFDEPESLAEQDIQEIPEDQMLEDAVVADAQPIKKAGNISNLTLKSAVSSDEAANSTLDFEIPDFDPENDDDSNLDFLSDNDETATKLDLARAYIDMGDSDGAKDILDEILDEGNDQQKKEAEALLSRIG